MKKKTLFAVVVIALVAACFSGCSLSCSLGSHTEKATMEAKAATCTENGYTAEIKCEKCGEILEESTVIPATGHTETTVAGKSEIWTDGKVCSVCGAVLQESTMNMDAVKNLSAYNADEPTYIVKKVDSDDFSDWDSIERQKIDVQNWSEYQVAYDFDPQSGFQAVHTDDSLIIYFTTYDDYVLSRQFEINSIVCDDACNEFFVTLADDPNNYFNFEMNSNGALYVGYGEKHNKRDVVDPELIKKYIKIYLPEPVINEETDTGFWGIKLTIDKEFFKEVAGVDIKDGLIKGSFYKCGSLIQGANHLLAWTKIPDTSCGFHTPSSFGNIVLE